MNENKRIVIVGGVAAGASCAARARRLSETAQITIIERGPDVSFANCGLPYYIGGEITDRARLALQTPQSLSALLNIKVRAGTEAIAVDRERRVVRVRRLDDGSEEELPYDSLVLAPGAAPLRPPMPGIDHPAIHTLRNLQDMDRLASAAREARDVLIIGAGFIGLEVAEQLAKPGKTVSLVELADQVLPQMDKEMTALVQDDLVSRGVRLFLGDGIQGFRGAGGRVAARLASGRELEADLVLLAIGVKPESSLAQAAGLTLGARGAISVNQWMQTSDPAIYAAGDVAESYDRLTGQPMNLPLGGPANRQGRVIADHIFLGESAQPYPGHLGTAIVRVFDTTAGLTGWTEKRLRQAGIPSQSVTVTDNQHAGYYPGAVPLTLKVIWDPASGKLLGAQATGADGVDKRLDVLATALAAGMTVEDLVHLELSYAPPFGSARDVVNTAGFAAQNIRRGLLAPVPALSDDGSQWIDLRPAPTAAQDPIPGTINIPFGELRAKLGTLDRARPVVTVCALGKTSYFGARILNQAGFKARSLAGGWRVARGPTAEAPAATREAAPALVSPAAAAEPAVTLDTTGMMCPGPLLKLKEAMDSLPAGRELLVKASDPGFERDVKAFCNSSGHQLLSVGKERGVLTARVLKSAGAGGTNSAAVSSCCTVPAAPPASKPSSGATLICFSGDLDKAMAAFIIATGAAAMGGKATIFFTFWGLNILRKDPAPAVDKDFMGKMFGMMMPRGADKLPLSQMHMGGMGTLMMKHRMASKNLPNLPSLMADARKAGVRLLACSMSMEAMGITLEELVDGVELGGVADMLDSSAASATSLFI